MYVNTLSLREIERATFHQVFLYFQQVCVKKCPEETIIFHTKITDAATFEQLRSNMVCTDDVNVSTMTYTQALQHIKDGKCASYVLRSQPGNFFIRLATSLITPLYCVGERMACT